MMMNCIEFVRCRKCIPRLQNGKESTVEDLIVVQVPEDDDETPGEEDELTSFEDDEGDSQLPFRSKRMDELCIVNHFMTKMFTRITG